MPRISVASAAAFPRSLAHRGDLFTCDRGSAAPISGSNGGHPCSETRQAVIAPLYPDFGGILDNKNLGNGATIYFPVQVEGELFVTGDPHAAKGDGEVREYDRSSGRSLQGALVMVRCCKPIVERAWAGILQDIYADGRLGSIQPIDGQPGKAKRSASYVYGVGGFYWQHPN